MTSSLLPVCIYRNFLNGRKCHLRRLQVEFLENGLSEGRPILHTYRGQLSSQTCWILRRQLLSVGCKMQLGTAQMCVKRVRLAYRCIIWSRFEARSPVMTHWIWLNVCRYCKVEWHGVLSSPTNWWVSGLLVVYIYERFKMGNATVVLASDPVQGQMLAQNLAHGKIQYWWLSFVWWQSLTAEVQHCRMVSETLTLT